MMIADVDLEAGTLTLNKDFVVRDTRATTACTHPLTPCKQLQLAHFMLCMSVPALLRTKAPLAAYC